MFKVLLVALLLYKSDFFDEIFTVQGCYEGDRTLNSTLLSHWGATVEQSWKVSMENYWHN